EQLELTGLQQERQLVSAQMQQTVALANQRAQMEAAQFNAQMGFNVAQANQQAALQRQQQLQGLAADIGTLAADPGDRGQFAAFALAISGFGQGDAALAGGQSLITDESLTPLESLLRQREDVQGQPANPYS